MKSYRVLPALLLASTLALGTHAQETSELDALRAKAEAGNGIAQYNLGLAYTRGGNVPANPVEAYVWLSLAQENGARGRALEALSATLDPSTLQTAQQQLVERRKAMNLAAALAASTPVGAEPTEATAAPVAALAAPASAPEDPSARLRAERDALATKITDLAAELSALRDERARLATLVRDHEKAAQASAVELAEARNFGQQVESTLNKVNDQKTQLEAALRAAQTAAPTEDQSQKIRELESQLVNASRVREPAYPDLSARVRELESQLAEARTAVESAQAATLAAQESAARAAASMTAATEQVPAVNVEELQQKLADTENKLATSLQGYAFLQRQTDEKTALAQKNLAAVTAERDDVVVRLADTDSQATAARAEVARLTEELAALRTSTSKETEALVAARAVITQLQGVNGTLARENYDLKARLTAEPAPVVNSVVASTQPAPVEPEPTAPIAPRAEARLHTIVSGDTLSKIAHRYYGDSTRWPEIYRANVDQLSTQSSLRIGAELRIP